MPLLFHGTSDVFLEEILKKGLCPPRLGKVVGTLDDEPKHIDSVYFTVDLDSAKAIGDQTVYTMGGRTAVIAVWSPDLRRPDFTVVKRLGEVAVRARKCIPPEKLRVVYRRRKV